MNANEAEKVGKCDAEKFEAMRRDEAHKGELMLKIEGIEEDLEKLRTSFEGVGFYAVAEKLRVIKRTVIQVNEEIMRNYKVI